MSRAWPTSDRAGTLAPPYLAALTVMGGTWRSSLTHDGHIPLVRPVVQIGRMEGNEVILSDPLVSRHHAVIRWRSTGYELEDLGSINGTFVQGRRLTGPIPLTPGQIIRLGNTELVFVALQHASTAGIQSSTAQAGAEAVRAARAADPQPGPPVTARQAVGTATGPVESAVPPRPPAGAIHPGPGAPMPLPHPDLGYGVIASHRSSPFMRMFRTELRKRYWRVFLLGLAAYFVVTLVLANTGNLHLVPLEMLLASTLVPVVFVIFCWEQSAFADMPPAVVGATFLSGAVFGLTVAAIIEPLLIPPTATRQGIGLSAAILIGLCEETAKLIAVVWFLRDRRLRSELDGLILGAASGMGFAALETAGYGFVAFLVGFAQALNVPNVTPDQAIALGIQQMNIQLLLRMAVAIFGHGVWTAIVTAAIWRERGQSTFRLTPSVLGAFGIAVGLHALWDWAPVISALPEDTSLINGLVATIGWFLLIGGLGLFILRFFIRESLQRAKLGPLAPPPPPLLQAILTDTFGSDAPGMEASPDWFANSAAPHAAPHVMAGAAPAASTAAHSAQTPGLPASARHMPASSDDVYCPRCALYYQRPATVCTRCGGPLVPRLSAGDVQA